MTTLRGRMMEALTKLTATATDTGVGVTKGEARKLGAAANAYAPRFSAASLRGSERGLRVLQRLPKRGTRRRGGRFCENAWRIEDRPPQVRNIPNALVDGGAVLNSRHCGRRSMGRRSPQTKGVVHT
jgi:hypothetical protein